MKRWWWLLLVLLGVLLHQSDLDQVDVLEDQMLAAGQGLDPQLGGEAESSRRLLAAAQTTTGCRVRLLSRTGRVLLDSFGQDEGEDVSACLEVAAALQGRYQPEARSRTLFVAVPRGTGGAVYLSHDLTGIQSHILRLRLGVAAGVALIALGWSLAGRRRALSSLRRRIEGAAPLEPIAEPQAGQEAAIAQGFNRVVRHLQDKVGQLEDERLKTRRFLEDVAHELKTPLTGLTGSVEALLKDGGDHPLLRQVARETERMQRLVGQLLDLQRLDRAELHWQVFELTSLVDAVLESLERRSSSEGLSLELEGPEQDLRVWADPDRIRQVLENLLDNALRCSPPGGRVTVTVEPGRVLVDDQGPGVDEAEGARIFERYSNGRAPAGSAGLGLAIAREIVSRHGQEIGLLPSSTGARFYFTLETRP